MRDIIFRGKASSGRWVYGSLIYADDYCCILESEDKVHPMDWPYLDGDIGTIDGKATPVDPSTVGQYTCLTDKNGEMIFVGDVLKTDLYGHLSSVIYNKYCAMFQVLFTDGYSEGFLDRYSEINHLEIVGNVYDNPDFLKGE